MPNKTIYVSENDVSLFEEAKTIAGEALSSVISRALREYVTRNKKRAEGMKEISLSVGTPGAESEKRFTGKLIDNWNGFSTDKQWLMKAGIYRTQKGNWVIYLTTEAKASLLLDKRAWKRSGDYLVDSRKSEMVVGKELKDFTKKIPQTLLDTLKNLIEKDEKPIEYLDI
jgi:EXLDI family protein